MEALNTETKQKGELIWGFGEYTGKKVFETLNAVNLNDRKEKKNNLDYISWAWAWAEVKKRYPEATSKVYEDARGLNYFTDGRTCYVKVGVTIAGLENIEYLPVMDNKNRSIMQEAITSMDVNKAIQRALTKAIARHGLGLYIYAGEDLPEEEATCEKCGRPVKAFGRMSASEVLDIAKRKYGGSFCAECMAAMKGEKDGSKNK